ncbi:hypothetical protein [Alicyclobacillus sp. ALC3]|uniref:hypothetical protein n=1 Tax=Alicyclobacillus sp. ALC3 TaxID=2796143 RepID=UPI0023785A28|nr:hypothetical protein [Alicyclobacillus sp. ALC3]WDL97872.1 hypothetical protein JC200_03860 [Alicyclobacillus sp. ALC3]
MTKARGPGGEGRFVRTVRDVSGVIGLIGVGILAGYALLNLRPGWEWTQEQNAEQLADEANRSR